jgi:mycoredoxin
MAGQVTVYGADWCGDTVRTKRHLDNKGVQYTFVDVDQDKAGEEKVIAFSKGKRRIPLVEIAGEGGQSKSMAVPSASELDAALG